MAAIGENLLGHRLDLVVKGDRTGAINGRVKSVGLEGLVIDLADDGEPWHIGTTDIARWRIACCPLRGARRWDCTEDPISIQDRHVLQRQTDLHHAHMAAAG